MAYSSAKEKYDVFISFRGVDTRKTFTSHLHAALIRRKIDTYIDYRLEKGDELEPALLKAIEGSKIYLIIFSEDYASSTWCLKELAYIMEWEGTNEHYAIPIFYDIEPSVVRHQKESYQIAFSEHEQRLDLMDKVLKWKGALTKAANRSGFSSTSKAVRDDNDLVEQVVRDVLTKLNRQSTSNLTDQLVGVEARIQSIVRELDIIPMDSRVRFVVIWGMGGIGKTTLADAVYHGLSSQFEACCFLANVREGSGAKGELSPQLYSLRDELLRELLGDKHLTIHTPTADSYVKERLNRTKVLVVLDDVNHLSQLEFLAGDQVPFGRGSRIIITTRDIQPVREMQLLRKVDYCDVKIYKVEELNGVESMQLFVSNSSAYSTENSRNFDRVLDYTAGIPLALKVLSRQFLQCKRQEDLQLLWEKLRKFPNKELQNVYRASFDGLERNEKEVFLDIACFHKGKNICEVNKILAACGLFPDDGIKILMDMSLISLKDDCIWMHDVIQQMAVDIVNEECILEPGNRSRLHNFEDISHVLENNKGTGKVQSIYCGKCVNSLTLHPQAFTELHNLRFLMLRSIRIDVKAGLESLPNALKYIFWNYCPLKYLPSKYLPMNLVELHMPHSKLHRLWNKSQDLVNLKTIDLSYAEELVDVAFLSNCVNIESINLKGCTSLVQVPDLTKSVYIKSIDLHGCKKLVQVPDLSKSVNIESIDLQSCGKLVTVLSYFENFTKLTNLNLGGCSKIGILPKIPRTIEFLDLCSIDITSLSSVICSLEALVVLNLQRSYGVRNLSSCEWKMKSLTHLSLIGTDIEKVPSSIECMTRLISVNLSDCQFLVSLPTNIWKLKSLKRLDLPDCLRLTDFPEILEPMESLEYLDLSGSGIEELPSSVGNLVGLKTLELSFCRLTSLPSCIYNLTCLESLILYECEQLQSLPVLPCLLQELDARGCISLKTVSVSVTPLTQGLDQIDGARSEKHCFTGCNNLDTNARSNIMDDAHSRIMRMATACNLERLSYGEVELQFVGSEIPKWFYCQTDGSSINIKLPPHWSDTKLFLGCASDIGGASGSVECKMILKTNNAEGRGIDIDMGYMGHTYVWNSNTNNVVVWYRTIYAVPEAKWSTEASFDFYVLDSSNGKRLNCVRKCGVSFLYADGQDDIRKFEVIHPTAESSRSLSWAAVVQCNIC